MNRDGAPASRRATRAMRLHANDGAQQCLRLWTGWSYAYDNHGKADASAT